METRVLEIAGVTELVDACWLITTDSLLVLFIGVADLSFGALFQEKESAPCLCIGYKTLGSFLHVKSIKRVWGIADM